jgi:hypothetical protein
MHAADERPDPFDRYPGELETARDVVSVTDTRTSDESYVVT